MKPVDPRLWRYARATRGFLLALVVLGGVGAGLLVGQAMLVADIVVGAFQHGRSVAELRTPLLLSVAVACGRAVVGRLTESAAHRAAAAVKSELRIRLLDRAAALGPGWLSGQRTGSLVTLATRGVDALDEYFSRYLPQLGLAVVVPTAVLARIVTEDWVSAAIIVGTLPLIPVFMVLIGWATQSRMDRQWRLLSRLSGHFLDVVVGLPTLKVFGRARAQAESIKRITDEYRRATMRTLRVAFLSSFALELLATLSVALVAVTIGMRLVHGEMTLYHGLLVLLLAPEAYLPLRQVGARYHAAAEGLAAAEDVFRILETPAPRHGHAIVPRSGAIDFDGVTVRRPGRSGDVVTDVTFTVRPGETVALVGPSGAGKSTLVDVVLGFVKPAAGHVRVGGVDLAEADPALWRARVAWVPQRPHVFAGTVADNVRLARPDADDAAVRRALRHAGALAFVDALPEAERTVLGEDGTGLSAGQRQRLALARAFLADRPILLMDEPTAALDGTTEADVVEAVRRLSVDRTVLLVTHRPALLRVADRVVRLPGDEEPSTAPVASPGSPAAAPSPSPSVAGGEPAGPEDGGGLAVLAPGRSRGGRALVRVRAAAPARRGRLGLALLLGSLALGSAVGLMATSGWLISRAAQQPPVLYLMLAVTATRAFGIGRAVFRYAERLVSHDAVLRMLADTRVAVYRRLERLAPAGLRDRRRGDLLVRLVADVDALQDHWLRWWLPAGSAVVVSGAAVAFTAWMLPEAGAVLAAGLLAAGVGVPAVTASVARRADRRLAPARAALAVRVTELFGGIAELTVAGALRGRAGAVRRADAELTRIASREARAVAIGDGLTALVSGLTLTAGAFVVVRAVADGRFDGLLAAVTVLTCVAAFEGVLGMPLAVQHRQRVRRSAERVSQVLDAPDPVVEPESPRPAPDTPFPLVLRGLRARHPGQHRPALDGVDLTLAEGRRLAVVGPSGSGKTTLAGVLLRFLEAEEGSYTLGGVEARDLESDDVRRHVGLCAQDAHLFDSSLRENLLLARKNATDADLWRVLDRARLLEWVERLPEGLDTLVGEHGACLSGGQRQRLALARALLADFPVLVLDEPAEHLDLRTADALTRELLAATEGRTTVLITHRLAGLEAVDEVMVLEDGRVAQRGPFAELADTDGPLRAMIAREVEAEAVH
ncbi:thiol reductant ABC exporter subunit CydD [Streptomyces sp. HSG2]|uniref:thiol reductant ABC exporter subunit CydD n=1 Tax=Streptomyces sp. HSG2 TaxID=2797167 RepID=UPI0019051409|nr:thiol reductant ABC exporter subunit CydD [Streptomyces sp. HSG2]